jgi:hypothetical protein
MRQSCVRTMQMSVGKLWRYILQASFSQQICFFCAGISIGSGFILAENPMDLSDFKCLIAVGAALSLFVRRPGAGLGLMMMSAF